MRRVLRLGARVDGVLACCLFWAAGYFLSGVSCSYRDRCDTCLFKRLASAAGGAQLSSNRAQKESEKKLLQNPF